MPTTIGNIAINVSDVERSERFYVDVLGLEVLHRIDTPEVVWLIVGSSTGGSQLILAHHPDGGPVSPGGGLWKVFVSTDDVHDLFRRATDAGAEVVNEPFRLEQFGVTLAFVHDPDGHLIELGQQDS